MGLQLVSADFLHEDGILTAFAVTASSRISPLRRSRATTGSIAVWTGGEGCELRRVQAPRLADQKVMDADQWLA